MFQKPPRKPEYSAINTLGRIPILPGPGGLSGQLRHHHRQRGAGDGEPVTGSDLGNGVSAASFTIPAQKELGTLLWQDEASGLYCRLQSILAQETLLRMAESVK